MSKNQKRQEKYEKLKNKKPKKDNYTSNSSNEEESGASIMIKIGILFGSLFFIMHLVFSFINFFEDDNFSKEINLLNNHQEDLFAYVDTDYSDEYEEWYIFESVSNSKVYCKIQLDYSVDIFEDMYFIYNEEHCMTKDYQDKQLQAFGYINY